MGPVSAVTTAAATMRIFAWAIATGVVVFLAAAAVLFVGQYL